MVICFKHRLFDIFGKDWAKCPECLKADPLYIQMNHLAAKINRLEMLTKPMADEWEHKKGYPIDDLFP